jgi:hypothetical protein
VELDVIWSICHRSEHDWHFSETSIQSQKQGTRELLREFLGY